MVLPLSGRLALRTLSNGNAALMGILHLPQDFVPIEGAGYYAVLDQGWVLVMPDAIAPPLAQESLSEGVNSLLRQEIWRKSAIPGGMMVRFLDAFPDQNGWTVFGAVNKAPLPTRACGHGWWDITKGSLRAIDPPFIEAGVTCSQMLNSYPAWPDQKGVMHALPDIGKHWRQVFYDYTQLRAQCGAGEISYEELMAFVKSDKDMYHIRALSRDDEYHRYLAALRDAGGIKLNAPRSSEELTKHGALVRKCMAAAQKKSAYEAPCAPNFFKMARP